MLAGIRIVELSEGVAGPLAACRLADLGATVVKIESGDGDWTRGCPPFIDGEATSAVFFTLNRGKRSLALDLKHPKGREALLRLARDADVFLMNYRPGVAERLGIGYEELSKVNPRIIYARASGWGRDGPEAEEGSFDLLGQARGGLMSINGGPDGPPQNVGAPVADQVGGIMVVTGILAALWHRERTGEGQQVDTSLLGTVLALQSFNFTTYMLSGIVPGRTPRPSALPFWNTYAGSDGRYFVIGILQDRHWSDICAALGRPEIEHDERFADYRSRVGKHAKDLLALLDEAFAQRPAGEWVGELCGRGVFSALVQDYGEVVNDPQVLANEYIVQVERPDGPPVGMVTTPIQFTASPTAITRLAPELGQHTEEVLLEAGYSWDEIEALRNEGAIGPKHDEEAV